MKKVLLSIIAFLGAFSLLISILVFPNLVINERQNSWVKTLDIKQTMNITISDKEQAMLKYPFTFYSTSAISYQTYFPNLAHLEEDYNLTVAEGESISATLTMPLVLDFSIDIYEHDNVLIGYENLGTLSAPVFYGLFYMTITNTEGRLYYTDITFAEYYSSFDSSSILKVFSWVVENQKIAQENAIAFDVPSYVEPAEENVFRSIVNGFEFIGDIFKFAFNYVKWIYYYIQIPLDIYFIE